MEVINEKDKFNDIIHSVFTEVNEILNNWQVNGKKDTYEDKISLIKSLLARHTKHHFGFQVYRRHLQKCTIYPTINNYKLQEIIITEPYENQTNLYTTGLKNAILTYRVPKVAEIIPKKPQIDYESIINIKFN